MLLERGGLWELRILGVVPEPGAGYPLTETACLSSGPLALVDSVLIGHDGLR